MTARELARLITEPFGPRCRKCGRSDRRIPADQVERELKAWARSLLSATVSDLLKACRSVRQRMRTVVG
jgi:hypothetical protein